MLRNSLLIVLICFCQFLIAQSVNPPAEGFNAEASDAKAIELADEVMEAMGGRTAWDDTRYIRWTFFGRRTLLWDKWTGMVRIDRPEEKQTIVVDIHSGEGQVWFDGEVQTHLDTLAKYLTAGKSIWINDSYWLVMPYKLKDSGVTLKYIEALESGDSLRHKLQLTFENVGKTPENKYWVFVDDANKLIDEWQFFNRFDDESPQFSTPWAGYQTFGDILLGGDRGRGQLTDIGVFKEIPSTIFTSAAAYEVTDWGR